MKNINGNFNVLFFAVIFILSLNSCKKDQSNPTNPYNGKTTAVFNPNIAYDSITDQDGNSYKTVTIGTQTWMAENLRTTKYSNGDPIPNVTDTLAYVKLKTAAYCNYNNTKNVITIATNGRMYNWFAATDSRNIAPMGWHVPNNADWSVLIAYIGGDTAVGKLKEAGATHWLPYFSEIRNVSGFTALPSGILLGDGSFSGMGISAYWWSSISLDTTIYKGYGWEWGIDYVMFMVINHTEYKQSGLSVRCVKD